MKMKSQRRGPGAYLILAVDVVVLVLGVVLQGPCRPRHRETRSGDPGPAAPLVRTGLGALRCRSVAARGTRASSRRQRLGPHRKPARVAAHLAAHLVALRGLPGATHGSNQRGLAAFQGEQ